MIILKNSKKKRENINILKNFKNHDKILLVCTIILIITGLLNIVTASSRESVIQYDKSLYYYFFRQSVMIIAGIVISMVIINVDTKNYFFLSTILFIGIGILLLVPILSYIFLKGKCRYCGQKIRIRYLILEILSGVVFLLAYMSFGIHFPPKNM